jgi:hypothetical protein
MGGPVWEGAGPIKGDGPRLSFAEGGSVGLTLLCVLPLLASPSLLLAPPRLWPVPQLQVRLFLSLCNIHVRACVRWDLGMLLGVLNSDLVLGLT